MVLEEDILQFARSQFLHLENEECGLKLSLGSLTTLKFYVQFFCVCGNRNTYWKHFFVVYRFRNNRQIQEVTCTGKDDKTKTDKTGRFKTSKCPTVVKVCDQKVGEILISTYKHY